MNIRTPLYIVAALGIGFAAGKWLPDWPPHDSSSEGAGTAGGKSVTLTTVPDRGIQSDVAGNQEKDNTPAGRLAENIGHLLAAEGVYGSGDRVEASRRYLALDQLLSEASEEDILALLSGDVTLESQGNLYAVNDLIFQHLANKDPGIAAAVWLDRARKENEFRGAKGLLLSWVETSPAEAEAWVNSLPEGKIRNAGIQGLIAPLAERDANRAVDYLMTQESGWQLTSLVTAISTNLTDTEFASVADRFLAKKDNKWNHQAGLSALVTSWIKRDSGAALAWLARQDPGQINDYIASNAISNLVNTSSKGDYVEILDQLDPYIKTNPTFATGAGSVWFQWLLGGKDDQAAMAWFEKNGENLRTPEMMRWGGMNSMSSEDTLRIFDLVKGSPESPARTTILEGLIFSLSQTYPEQSLKLILENQPPGGKSSQMIASAVGYWAGLGEPEKAIQWTLDNMEPGNPRQTAVRFAMSQWADNDPKAAAEYLSKLPDQERGDSLWGLADRWGKSDQDAAIEFAGSLDEKDSSFGRHLFFALSEDEIPDKLLPKALSVPAGKRRNEALNGLFQGLARYKSDKAVALIESMENDDIRDRAIYGFVQGVYYEDQRAAMAWALQLQKPGERKGQLLRAGRRWLQSDKAGATEWIQNNAQLDDAIKTELLKPKQEKKP